MAAAAAAATTGGLLSLAPSHAPTPSPSFPPFGTSYRRHSRSRRQPRLYPLLAASSVEAGEASYTEPEEALLEALVGVQGRGRAVAPRQLQEVESAVQTLEALQGVPDPTNSSLIEGIWKLIFTTRPGTASPIQRIFVGVDSSGSFRKFTLEQMIQGWSMLSSFQKKLVNWQYRPKQQSKMGSAFSSVLTKQHSPSSSCHLRCHIRCHSGFLEMKQRVGLTPHTYLAVGTYVFQGETSAGNHICSPEKCRPKANVVVSYICRNWSKRDDLTSSITGVEADLSTLAGEWQLLWASQTEGESWSSVASAGLKDFQTIRDDGQLKNLVTPFPGVSLNARGNVCESRSSNTFRVSMNEGAVQVGGVQFPLATHGEFVMDILYIDNKIRISRLNQHELVHLRIAGRT